MHYKKTKSQKKKKLIFSEIHTNQQRCYGEGCIIFTWNKKKSVFLACHTYSTWVWIYTQLPILFDCIFYSPYLAAISKSFTVKLPPFSLSKKEKKKSWYVGCFFHIRAVVDSHCKRHLYRLFGNKPEPTESNDKTHICFSGVRTFI